MNWVGNSTRICRLKRGANSDHACNGVTIHLPYKILWQMTRYEGFST